MRGVYSKERQITEKITSVESDILWVQRGGIMVEHHRSAKTFVIPCTIPTPHNILITALNSSGRRVADAYYCDLTLYSATNANVSTALKYSATAKRLEENQLLLYNHDLYITMSAITATSGYSASPSLITGSKSLYMPLPDYASGNKCFLLVTTIASTASLKGASINYTVEGY